MYSHLQIDGKEIPTNPMVMYFSIYLGTTLHHRETFQYKPIQTQNLQLPSSQGAINCWARPLGGRLFLVKRLESSHMI